MAITKLTADSITSGAIANTPAFQAYRSSGQSISTSTLTKIQFNSESFDTDSDYDNSTNYRFTPQTSGKYYVYAILRSTSTNSVLSSQQQTYIRKNGSDITGVTGAELYDFYNGANLDLTLALSTTAIVELNGSTDYVECFHQSDAGQPFVSGTFGAYKIIE